MKVSLLLTHARVPFRVLPEFAGTAENLLVQAKRWALTRGLLTQTYLVRGALDEWPLVPFLFGPGGAIYSDSSAIGVWLHEQRARYAQVPLLPPEPAQAFLSHLIDEFIDELGLYMLHHQRWVRSARSTVVSPLVRREYRSMVPMWLSGWAAERFAARQVRRLPYLFSVAPKGFSVPGVPAHRQPPTREGFPETHSLLDHLRERMNAALTEALQSRPYLLGDAFTLADASVGGMLCSPLDCDPETAADLAARWPALHAYAAGLRTATTPGSDTGQQPTALIELAIETFLPFLHANQRAFERHGRPTAREANERAYWRGDMLYEAELLGNPYRTCVKTFQVAVLLGLQARYAALPATDRAALARIYPALTAALSGS